MEQPAIHSSDLFSRFSRRSMFTLLFIVVVLGGTGLAMTLSPEGAISRGAARGAWFIPIAIALIVGVQQSWLRGRRWAPDSREVKLVMEDEFRQTNMGRASRYALIVVLVAQWPIALVLGFVTRLPAPRAEMAMAIATITLGLVTLISLFLHFDRE